MWGGVAAEIGGELFTHVECKDIKYSSTDVLEDLLHKIDNPTSMFGEYVRPYCILFNDNVGDSPYGGGVTCIFGYQYATDLYGAQISIAYSGGMKLRRKLRGAWSDWKVIATA